MSDTLEVRIWRGGAEGGLVHYNVPRQASQTVLDVVTWVQRNDDPSLAYRFACRVGMCGSCAMTVNGRPRWTCRTHVDKVTDGDSLTIEPLGNVPVIKDLAADMTPFFEKWQSARGRFHGAATRRDAYARIKPDSPARQTANAHVECINCAVCYSACDVVSWRKEYLGPAALNRAWVAFNDERDAHLGYVLRSVAVNGGCMSCHTHQSCTQHCPVGLDPSAAIAGLKKALSRAYLSGRLKLS
ncbi:succinate dehydrogenase/fumarate reductase iron-sulfur subunit [Thioalkalivibrio sp. HK1]|uniref:succinate dehydrogenase/fumarate reductase iron-sulfur subunit n=1 Tax=Thioalkalivibrio sp. HK1 TaxID=1469245 RepID=UPI000470A6E7|nr:2Fe-2S iron-sulfur cluster-binding protein [Thioalkalivibrio sp. HK1]